MADEHDWKDEARKSIAANRPLGPFLLWIDWGQNDGWSYDNHPTQEAARAAAPTDREWCITGGMLDAGNAEPSEYWVGYVADIMRAKAEREAAAYASRMGGVMLLERCFGG